MDDDKAGLLTFRFVIGRRLITVAVPPSLICCMLLVGVISYTVGYAQAGATRKQQAEMLAALRQSNLELKCSLAEKELERDQMVALAEARSDELWEELESRDEELARLWRIVGPAPGPSYPRYLLSSRGQASRPALAVKAEFNQLQLKFSQTDRELKELTSAANDYRNVQMRAQRARLARITPSLKPCRGTLTSGFGNRLHPVQGISKFHNGCDFTAPYGASIQATAAGTVVTSDWMGGYGKTVEIDHGEGLKTLYAHCEELKVRKGQAVAKGQTIATVGTTGVSSGPHCHYEVHRNGKPVNPVSYLPRRGR